MSEWPVVSLTEVLRHRKGSITIDNQAQYSLCRVQLHRRGVVERGKQFGHEIKTKKQQLCKAGDLIVAEMDAKFGGYGFIPESLDGAIVSSHYYLYELDQEKLDRGYMETLIAAQEIQKQIEAKGSTNYSSIRAWEFLEYKIPLPPLEKQKRIAAQFHKFERFSSLHGREAAVQSSYLTQLRQAILQEAIEGKLTAEWRRANSASSAASASGNLVRDENNDAAILLEKIKKEKKVLAESAKPAKKEKELPPIEPGEVPFALPEGWVWTRLGEIGFFGRGKSKHRPRNDPSLFKGGNIPFVQTGEVAQSKYNRNIIEEAKRFYNKNGLAQSKLWPKGTLCITIAANIAETGFLSMEACFPDSVVGFTSLTGEDTAWYVKHFLTATQSQIIKFAPATAQKNINLEIIGDLLFPLPPLAEQHAIVERVYKLLAMVDQLEQQVAERKVQAEELMQAVLREAFG